MHYELLPSSLEEEEESFSKRNRSRKPSMSPAPHRASAILTPRTLIGVPWKIILSYGLCILTCLTTASAATSLVIWARATTSSVLHPAPQVLRRVSPYINQDRLRDAVHRYNTTFKPVENVGPASFQTDADHLDRSIREDASRQESTEFGTIWPEDRRVLVNHNVFSAFL